MGFRVCFRVDASAAIGAGHVVRCLALAESLRRRNARCVFVCRQQEGNLQGLILNARFEVRFLPFADGPELTSTKASLSGDSSGMNMIADAEQTIESLAGEIMDWIVVDHYALGTPWESAVKERCANVLAIDDLANRPHDCRIVLDHNVGRSEGDYHNIVAAGTRLLIGPRFALLRQQYNSLRSYSFQRRKNRAGALGSLLVAFGGSDHSALIGEVLNTLRGSALPKDLLITVVIGFCAGSESLIRAQAAAMPWPTRVIVGANNMAQLMADSDLAIGAAGTSALERCALGLPSLAVVLADNQRQGAYALQSRGAAIVVSDMSELGVVLNQLGSSPCGPQQLLEMSRASFRQVDACGAGRVSEEMLARTCG